MRPLFRSFAAGEIAPEAFGRIDLDKLQTGLGLCRNFITLPHGPAQNRPGFAHIIEAKFSDSHTILIPFIYNTDQAYALEFGHQYIRVHTEGGTVLEGAQGIESVDTPNSTIEITDHGLDDGEWVYVNNLEGLDELEARYFKVVKVDDDNVSLLYLDDTPVDFTVLTAYVSGGDLARVFEVATPYESVALDALHYTQSADVMTLVHPDYQQRELARYGATTWTLSTIDFDPAQAAPTGITATANPTSGSENYSYTVTALSADQEESFAGTADDCTNNLTVAGNKNTITWTNAAGATRYNVYKELNGLYGYIGQATDGTIGFVDDNYTPDISQTPPESSDPFTTDYPGAVGYFEGRRWFAGSTDIPQGVWATRAGAEGNMARSIPVRDDDAIAVRLRAQRADRIRHIVPLNDLLLLTSGGEWRVTAQNSDSITPKTISYRIVGAIGANQAQPVVTSESVVYCQAAGGRMREMLYSWEAQSYRSNDLSVLASHLFDGCGIYSMAMSRAPHQIIWCVRGDGVLLGVTYLPEHKVVGWHQHTTAHGLIPNRGNAPSPPPAP